MNEDLFPELQHGLNQFVGEICWGIAAGRGTGSIVSLHFGAKMLRRIPLNNPHLSNELREYDSQMGLFITCSWRLDSDSDVICGWTDSNEEGGPMLSGLQKIVGQKVKQVDLILPGLDLGLHFSNSLLLRIFSDRTDSTQDEGNYTVFLPRWAYVVGIKSKLKKEARGEEGIS